MACDSIQMTYADFTCMGYEIFEAKPGDPAIKKPCRVWGNYGIKGNGKDLGKCMVREIYDPTEEKYQQFMLPSLNKDKAGNVIYPKVRYVKMDLVTQVDPNDPSSKKLPFFDALETFKTNANNEAPVGLKNLIQGSMAWSFMPTEK